MPTHLVRRILQRLTKHALDSSEEGVGVGLQERESSHPSVYSRLLTDAEIAGKRHRDFVGGKWEEIGRWQFEFLRGQGLLPNHRLLDVGCGCLRGGIHFVHYLEPGCYYGIDKNASLIQAGREVELPEAGLAHKQPHLRVNDTFDFAGFATTFPFALAQSLFTHLPIHAIERCLVYIAKVLEPGGRFFATYFDAPAPHHLETIHRDDGIVTHSDRDPFHYHFSVFRFLVHELPLTVRDMGVCGHPRGQRMLEFVRM